MGLEEEAIAAFESNFSVGKYIGDSTGEELVRKTKTFVNTMKKRLRENFSMWSVETQGDIIQRLSHIRKLSHNHSLYRENGSNPLDRDVVALLNSEAEAYRKIKRLDIEYQQLREPVIGMVVRNLEAINAEEQLYANEKGHRFSTEINNGSLELALVTGTREDGTYTVANIGTEEGMALPELEVTMSMPSMESLRKQDPYFNNILKVTDEWAELLKLPRNMSEVSCTTQEQLKRECTYQAIITGRDIRRLHGELIEQFPDPNRTDIHPGVVLYNRGVWRELQFNGLLNPGKHA
ncbi:MAG: hypothetical protein GY861_08910 [bacterium]|nr:hypothetical protein [bacterium]